jgi:predicted nucleotide-binding protein (sugar kinase/HSP70/actin superfamily)
MTISHRLFVADGTEGLMRLRIGIPRAIQFYQHYPLWRTYFEELGAETVVSPTTNREVLTAGAQVVADVTCLPVKVYAGHVCWLRDHGNIDFVFSPAIWNLEKDAFHCSKLKGLPDIMKATVPNCPPLLVAEVDPYHRKLYADDAFYKVGRKLTRDPWKVQRAWAKAKEVDANYRTLILREQITYPEAMARLYGSEWLTTERVTFQDKGLVIGLVGHPYCLYDDYINHNLIKCLGKLGVRVITSEMAPADAAQRGIERTTRQTRWFYENWMSGAAGYFLYESNVDGVITVLAFGCGPDSTMVETITRRAHAIKRSCLNLILDEHGSPTGMVTRLEAYVDMLSRQKNAPKKKVPDQVPDAMANDPKVFPSTILSNTHRPVIGIPSMGTTAVAIKSLFEGIGAQVEMGPPVSKRTVSLGAQSSPEFICTPYKQILGNMIEMLEAGADTLIYVEGIDLCRNSSYYQMLGDALRDLGYKFRMMSFGEIFEGGMFAMPKFLRQFAPKLSGQELIREIVLAIVKMRVIDEIERRVQYIRPREIVQGTVDKLWEDALKRIEDPRDQKALKKVKIDIQQKMDAIETDPARQPVKVGVTGEIFAVLDPFYNHDIERTLGRQGAEVHRLLMIGDWLQGEMILRVLGFQHEKDIDRAAKSYLRADVAGDGWITLGRTVICAENGFDGMVELLPFSCLPEITALNILPRVIQDHNIPVIPFIFDEQSGRAGMHTRVEAFVDLLYRRRELSRASTHLVPPGELPRQTNLGEEVCTACPVLDTCTRETPDPRLPNCKLKARGTGERRTA